MIFPNNKAGPILSHVGTKILEEVVSKPTAIDGKRCFWSDYFKSIDKRLSNEVFKVYYPKEVSTETKVRMSEVLFELEQKYEYKERTRYKANAFRKIRNMIYDDLGINENRGKNKEN